MQWSVISPLRLAILDDHALIREALEARLQSEPDFKVVAVHAHSVELIALLRLEKIDVVILDYQLTDGEMDGLGLIQTLRSNYPQMRIVVYSSLERAATVNLAIGAGANGFFGKSQPTPQLVMAIRTVALDRLYLPPLMAAEFETRPCRRTGVAGPEMLVDYPTLSPKEREVLRCCLSGMSVSQIAIKFLRSRKTISGQKQSAFRKLNVRTDTELFKLHQHLHVT